MWRSVAWCAALWLLSAAGVATALAQVPETPQFRRLGVVDGLPSNGISAITQDHQGYIWLASNDGLARYDGVDVRVYQFAPGNPSSVPGNVVQALHVDARDRIWVALEGHGLRWLGADRRGFHRPLPGQASLLDDAEIWAITSTPDGAVWFGSFGGGLFRLGNDHRLSRFQHVPGDLRSLPADSVLALAVDDAGQLWVGTTAGAARWTGRDFEALPVAALSAPVVFSLSVEAGGRLWLGTPKGLDVREADGRIGPAPWRGQLSEAGVTAVLKDRHGTRWIATRRGLNRERDGRVEPLTATPAAGIALHAAFEDHEGGLWFGTGEQGVLRLPDGWRHFGVFSARAGDRTSLGNPVVEAMAAADDGRVWLVGNGGSLDRMQVATGAIEHVRDGPDGFPYHRLYAVQQRRDGSVWVGHQLGLSRVDPDTGRARHWLAGSVADASLAGPTSLLCETGDGLLWSSSLGYGLQARDDRGVVRVQIVPGDGHGLDSADPEQLLAGPEGALWLAGGQGVLRWDAGSQRFHPVPGAPHDRVYSLLFLPPETLWLHRLGVLEAYRWDGQRLQAVRRVGSDDGLPAVESGGLLADRAGSLWLTTPRGLLRYDPVSGRLRQYGEREGLPSQEFVSKAPLMTASGIAVASTTAGVVLFDPARMRSERRAPRLVIERLSVRRAEDEFDFATDARQITLTPDDRDLRVSARLLSFADSRAHRYRFRLTGYDPDWVDVGGSGERIFSRLEPGVYPLQVRAANADGVWSPAQRLQVTVLPPWWRTLAATVAGVMLGVLLLALAAWAYRQRLRRLHAFALSQQQQALAEQNSQAKSRFLATLGHEIRTPMTGVLGMAELLLGADLPLPQRARVQAIQSAGQHLLGLLDDALDLARIEAGKLGLDAAPFDLRAVLETTAALLQPLAQAKGLVFSLALDASLPTHWLGDAKRVRQIVMNLASNAIKFTDAGVVAVSAQPLASLGVLIEVSDTGPGLDAAQQARLFQRFEQADGARTAGRYGGSGLGLAICRELAQAMAGDIELVSAPSQGARFRVRLPLPVVPEPLPESLPEPPAERRPDERGLSVLLVEDDALVAEVISGLLGQLGHRVQIAPHALAALSVLAGQVQIDLAFVDLDLPGMDGLQLARLLRAQGHHLPLVALTASADPEAQAQASAAGMTGFLRKPVTAQQLGEVIARGKVSRLH